MRSASVIDGKIAIHLEVKARHSRPPPVHAEKDYKAPKIIEGHRQNSLNETRLFILVTGFTGFVSI
jgi:hypothetical protein